MKTIAAINAKKIIDEKGLKQCAVAERAGIDENQFSAMLNGRKIIRDIHIVPLSQALGVPPSDLFRPQASNHDQAS